jgi:hypothetical protein
LNLPPRRLTQPHRGIALSGLMPTPPGIIQLGGVVRLRGPLVSTAMSSTRPITGFANWRRPYFLGFSQASVTALSMMCRSTLLHLGQLKVRKSWPNALGSIAVNFIGEPQAVQHGPWFCESSIRRSPRRRPSQFGACNELQRHRSDVVCTVTRSVRSHFMQSKVRRSKPKRAGLTQARTIGALHLEH